MAVSKKAPAKKKPAAKGQQPEVSKSDLVKKYKKFNKTIARTGKETAPTGYVEDAVIIKALGLKPGKGVTVKARLTSAKFVSVNDSDVLKLRFVIQEGDAKGTPVSQDYWFNPDDDEQTTSNIKELVFLLQKLGYETDKDLDIESLVDLAEDLSEEKPYCIIYVNCYKGKSGKNKGKEKIGLRVNSSYDPEASEEDDDEDDEEDEDDEVEDDDDEEEEEDSEEDNEEEEEEPVKKSSKKASKTPSKTSKKKAAKEEEEEDEEEDEEEEEAPKSKSKKAAPTAKSSKTAAPSKSKKKEEELEYEDVEDDEEEEEIDPEDPSTWVGQTAKIKPTGEKKLGNWEITKFDKKKNLLSIKQGKVAKTCSPDDVKDFVDE